MAAKFPTSVATDADLSIASNSLQTTLSGAVDNVVTSIPLTSTSGFPTAGYVTIDNEVIQYAGVSGGNLTGATRGADGTSAASHLSAAPVSATIVAAHHNALKDEVKAVESWLDTVIGKATTVTSTVFGYLVGVTSSIQTQLNGKQATGSYLVSPLTGDLAAGTHKITGIGDGSGAQDVPAFHQIPVITPGQIVGTATNDNAAAGKVGEYVSASVANVLFSGTTGQSIDAASISLTAGDWDVSLVWAYSLNAGSPTCLAAGIFLVAGNNLTGASTGDNFLQNGIPASSSNPGSSIAAYRMSLSTTTTVYAKAYAEFTGNAQKVYMRISARRVR